MEHLPPTGWGDVARKRDVDALQSATRRDVDVLQSATRRDLDALAETSRLEHELLEQRLLATMRAETRTLLFALLSSVISVGGLAFAAARLT